MERWSRYTTFAVTILMVLAISAMQVVPVLADDAAPPPTETPEVVDPAAGGEVTPATESPDAEAAPADVVEAAPEATSVATEAPAEAEAEAPAVTEEVPAVNEEALAVNEEAPAVNEEAPAVNEEAPAVAEEPAAEPAETPAEILAQVPEGTDLVVLDENGEALPLVTEEAAEIVYNGDPKWCPVGVTPSPTSTACSPSFTSFNDPDGAGPEIGLIQWLLANPKSVAGVIWVEGTYSSAAEGGAITLDGSAMPTVPGGTTSIANFALTIKGGWTGTGTTINTSVPSTFGVSLNITNWNGNITLSDIVFSGVTTGTALTVITTKNITATNVKVGKESNHNTGPGAVLNNYIGTGNVTITNSDFSYNDGGDGLNVFSKGTITLKDVNANRNGGIGAVLDNCVDLGAGCTTPLAKNVILTGVNVLSENAIDGLTVSSKGAITLSNLVTNSNGGWGAYLNNTGATTALGVTLTGSSQFKFNGGGLMVSSNGAITLNNITAINNSNYGTVLNNTSSPIGSNVTLTGTNTFDNNSSSGIRVNSKGVIALSNVQANNNGGYGVELYNDTAEAPKAVTLTVSNGYLTTEVNDNYSGGLYISSLGAITLSNLNATNNGWDCSGDPCVPVSGAHGAFLNNALPNAVGGIAIKGWGSFGNNGGSGLEAYSKGAITLTNLWTWGNQNYGAILDNSVGTGAVTITGNTGHWGNSWYGLAIYSKGAITLARDVTANNNGNTGVVLDNTASGTALPQNVTLNGANHEFNWNGGDGLEISSYGMVITNNLYANGNNGHGVLIDNCFQSGGTCATNLAKAITLNGNNTFEWNGGNGLDLTSKGVITVNNVVARENGGFGAYFDNLMAGTTAAINVKNTLTAWPEFSRNGLDGLRAISNGTITVMDLDAYENGTVGDPAQGGYGVYLYNAGPNGVGNIILGTSRANWHNGLNNNFLSGLEVTSNGTVTLSNLRANDNGHSDGAGPGYGVYVDNSGSSLPKAVVLKGTNDFVNDYNGGLSIISTGAITLNNVSANDSGMGVYLDNTASGTGTPQNITLTGFGDFFNNYNNGLEVYSYGAITLNNINAGDNGQRSYQCELSGDCPLDSGSGFGVYLDNSGATAVTKPAVTLNGGNNFSNNADYGLQIVSLGAIKVNNLDANNNGVWWDCDDTGCATIIPGYGALLNNSGAGAVGGVTITGGASTANNSDYGLQVTSKGAITINVIDMWAGNNGGFGWNLDNQAGSGNVTLTTTAANTDWAFDFNNNGDYGLWVQSLGNITIAGLDSSNNGWNTGNGFGARLDNTFGASGTVTIAAPVAGNNDFSGNRGDGLLIYSNSAITLGKLNANDNGQDCSTDPCTRLLGNGVVLDNSGASSPQNVTLTGFGDFHNNGSNGLTVLSYGTITLSNINISDNGQYNYYAEANGGTVDPTIGWGAYLDNCGYDSGLDDCDGTLAKGITLNGSNSFNNNYQDGLWATSLGAIKANNVSASNNRIDGAYLDNQWDGAVGGVTLTTSTALNWNTFDGNGDLGLAVYSHGAITSNNLQANHNRGGGASLNTDGVSIPQAVTLNGKNLFRGNGDYSSHTAFGLKVSADGNITLSNVTALWNDGDGVHLDNCQFDVANCTGVGNIVLKGTNNFRGNYDDGLYFDAGGTASLTKVTADGNGNDGMRGFATKNITLTCGSMTSNGGYGWQLSAWGTPNLVTLQGVFAYGNGAAENTNLAAGTLVQTRTCPLP